MCVAKCPKKPVHLFGEGRPLFTVARGWELGGGQSCSPQAPGATVALTMFRNMGAHHSPLLGGTAGCARAVASDLVTYGRPAAAGGFARVRAVWCGVRLRLAGGCLCPCHRDWRPRKQLDSSCQSVTGLSPTMP